VKELGTDALQQGDPATAKSYYSRMLEIYRTVYPGGHYLVGTATSNLGSACLAAKELRAAEKFFRDAVVIFTRTQSADHLNTGIARIKLGRTLLRQNRFEEAATETEAGVGILQGQMNPSASWLNAARTDLAEIHKALGRKGKEAAVQLEIATRANK
jgi:serine/threonine-protein kinase